MGSPIRRPSGAGLEGVAVSQALSLAAVAAPGRLRGSRPPAGDVQPRAGLSWRLDMAAAGTHTSAGSPPCLAAAALCCSRWRDRRCSTGAADGAESRRWCRSATCWRSKISYVSSAALLLPHTDLWRMCTHAHASAALGSNDSHGAVCTQHDATAAHRAERAHVRAAHMPGGHSAVQARRDKDGLLTTHRADARDTAAVGAPRGYRHDRAVRRARVAAVRGPGVHQGGHVPGLAHASRVTRGHVAARGAESHGEHGLAHQVPCGVVDVGHPSSAGAA